MSLINSLKGDKIIWIVVLALSIFSFLPVYSASSNFGVNMIFSSVFKHVAIIFIGIIIMYTTHLIDYKYLRGLSLIVLPLAIVLLLIGVFNFIQLGFLLMFLLIDIFWFKTLLVLNFPRWFMLGFR